VRDGQPPDQVEALLLDHFLLDDLFKGVPATTLKHRCRRDATRARLSWAAGDVAKLLEIILYRLTVLRNRVMHGCATYGPASKGLLWIRKGVCYPALLALMITYGQLVRWDPIPYPRVGFEDPHEELAGTGELAMGEPTQRRARDLGPSTSPPPPTCAPSPTSPAEPPATASARRREK
jgi:hypothetical protein